MTREMGISHGDFLRILPAVIRGRPFQRLSNGALCDESGRRLNVRLSAESHRRLGMLTIPVTTVELEFYGYAPEAVARFTARFERHFHRGAG